MGFLEGISPPRRQDLFPLFCRARRYAGFRPAGRVSFPAMGKKPMARATLSCPFGAIHLENRRGTPQRRTPFANDGLPPGPHLRGPQLGDQGSQRKGAGAQLNGSRSMTAAAERAVTFGSCFYRWTARLLSCLGSSAAQGIGGRVIAPLQVGSAYVGRVRAPAPTGDLEAALSLGGGMRATRSPSSVWPNGQPPYPFWPSAISP